MYAPRGSVVTFEQEVLLPEVARLHGQQGGGDVRPSTAVADPWERSLLAALICRARLV